MRWVGPAMNGMRLRFMNIWRLGVLFRGPFWGITSGISSNSLHFLGSVVNVRVDLGAGLTDILVSRPEVFRTMTEILRRKNMSRTPLAYSHFSHYLSA